MESILERLLAAAHATFGPRRAAELRPVLEQTAEDLAAVSAYALDPDDAV